MKTHEYTKEVLARASNSFHHSKVPINLHHAAMGLSEEAAEVLSHVRKAVFYGKELDRNKVAEELGDALWFLTLGAAAIGSDLDSLMASNTAKLRTRYGEVFTEQAAIERRDAQILHDVRDTLSKKIPA